MKFLNVDIRPMELKDLDAVCEIENLAFKDPWKKEYFLQELNNEFANLLVVELSSEGVKKQVVAFCDYWITFDIAQLCNIGVHPYLQHRQLGSAMMDEILFDCKTKKIRAMTLEVRKSNQNAINFYQKYGFSISHIKERYYSDGEDAFYMIQEFKYA